MIKSKLISLVLGTALITSGISTSSASIIPSNIISSTENLISNFEKTTENVVNYIMNSKKAMIAAKKELIKYENLSQNLNSQNKQLEASNAELKSENNNLNNQLSNIRGHFQATKIASLYYALSNNRYFYNNPSNCSIVIDHILNYDLGYSADPYMSDYLNRYYPHYSNVDFINNVSPNTIINEINSIPSLRGSRAMASDTDIINYILVNNLGYFYGNYYPQIFGNGLYNSSGNVSSWDVRHGLSIGTFNYRPQFSTEKNKESKASQPPSNFKGQSSKQDEFKAKESKDVASSIKLAN